MDTDCPYCNAEINHDGYLNGSPHDYHITNTLPRCCSVMRCSMCGEERELTEKERSEHGVETKQAYVDRLEKKYKNTTI